MLMQSTRTDFAWRWGAVRGAMAKQKIAALVVTHLADVRWLCGFTGSNAALAVTARKAALFTDGRYTAQAKEETRGARVAIAKKSALRECCALLDVSSKRAWFDPEHTTLADLSLMRSGVSGKKRRGFFVALEQPLVSALRMVKDGEELALMTKAAAMGCQLFEQMLPRIEAGRAEMTLAAELEYEARKRGAEGMSFETILASGRAFGAAAWAGDTGQTAPQRIRNAGLRCYPQWLLFRHDAHRARWRGQQ